MPVSVTHVFKGGNLRFSCFIFLKVLFLMIFLKGSAQTGFQHAWSKVITSNAIQGGNTIGNGIVADAQGNTYVVGTFAGTADMDPGPDTFNLISIGQNAFVAKYTSSGSLLWARSLGGGTSTANGKGIALDNAGNVYITGNYNGTMSVDMPFGKTTLTSVGNTNFFVAKFSNSGQFLMAFSDGFGFDQGNTIAVDGAGNILVGGTGNALGSLVTAYFAKYDASGQRLFLHRVGGGSSEWVQRIAADANNNIYITGNMQRAGDYDPGPNTFTLTPSVLGVFDVFMAKYDPAGNFIFANKVGGDNRDEVFDMALDASGNMYITGMFEVTGDFDPGPGTAIITGGVSANSFFARYDQAGNYVYAKALGGGFTGERGNGIAADAQGNVYVTGYFGGTADFDPGPGVFSLTSTNGGANYLAGYDGSGNFLMAKNIGGTSLDITVAGSKFWITGDFAGNNDFDPSASNVILTTSGGIRNAMHAAYSLAGNYISAGQFGGYFGTVTLNEIINQSVTDADGNIYIIGNFVGTVDFDPGPGVSLLVNTNNTTTDIFFAKYSAAGDLLFCRRIGANGNDVGLSIAVDQNRNIIITGSFTVTVDFDPGPGTANLANGSTTQPDFFLAKYNANGDYLWAYRFGNTSTSDQGRYVTVDAAGNIYCTGLYTGTVDMDFGAGTANLTTASSSVTDIFIAKYDADGAYQMAFSINGPDTKFSNILLTDAEGNIVVAGTFESSIDMDPSANSAILNSGSTAASDVFFAKYSPAGAYLMGKKIGSSTTSMSETVNAMALAANGDIILTGSFARTIDFDLGAGTVNLGLASGIAMYIARYTTNGDYVFARMIGTEGTFSSTTGTTLGLDAGGNILAAGTFNTIVDLDPGAGTAEAEPIPLGNNVLMVKLNPQGDYLGSGWIGGTRPMQAVNRGMHTDAQGNVTIAGVFGALGDFDPTGGIVTRSASSGNDIFLAKFTTAAAPSHYTTAKAGDWNDPATWIGGQVPPQGAAVKLLHVVDISGNISVKSMEVSPAGGVNLAAGAQLTVQQ